MSVPEYSIAKFKNVMLPMRDGVRLATDVYRPARDGVLAEGTFPTILCRTSYDKSAQRYVDIADYFTPHGYVVGLQDLRGRFDSEGLGQYFHVVNVNEGNDGYDTVEWIAAQPWSNGRVGMVGSSHPGLTQTLAALHRPPHLIAIWPDVVPVNSHKHQAARRRDGLQMFGALFVHAMDAQEFRANPAGKQVIIDAMEHLRDLVYATPFKPGQTPLSVVPNLEETLINYYTRGAYDEYWALEPNDFTRNFDRHADIPVMLTGGWFDLFADATPVYYARMREQNKAPARLIMGPWTHTQMRNGISYAGNVDCGPDSVWGNVSYFAAQALVRPLAEGYRHRRRGGCAGADLRHGRRGWAAHARRPPESRRPLARRAGVAAGPHTVHHLLPACGQAAIDSRSDRQLTPIHLRPFAPSPDDWREFERPDGADPAGRRA